MVLPKQTAPLALPTLLPATRLRLLLLLLPLLLHIGQAAESLQHRLPRLQHGDDAPLVHSPVLFVQLLGLRKVQMENSALRPNSRSPHPMQTAGSEGILS